MPSASYAEWLQATERLVVVDEAVIAARWGSDARDVTASSSLAVENDAIAEAARRFAFRSGPLVEERVVVESVVDVAAIRGRVVTVSVANGGAYDGGAAVFVLGGEVDHAQRRSVLNVLRKL